MMVVRNFGREIASITGLRVFKGTAYGPPEYLSERQKQFRRMNLEEYDMYHKKVAQSKGFDVDGCTGFMPGRIIPITTTSFEWKISNIAARFAAYQHGGDRLEVLSLDKANIQPVQGIMYYLTFTAMDTVDNEKKTYRAKVCFEAPSDHFRLLYFKEFKLSKKSAVTPRKARGRMSRSKISKSKAKKGAVLQARARARARARAGGVLPGFTALLRRVKSENPTLTHAMARNAASKKWKSLSNVEKQSLTSEASRK